MGRFNFRFSDLRIKSKLVVLISIFLLSHILIAFVASFLFRTLETLNIVVNEQRVFLENFHKGIEDFYEFEITGNTDELNEANENFSKAYQIAYTFAHMESIMEEMPEDKWVASFYDIFGEGVQNKDQIKLLGNQIKLLSQLDNESLTEVKATAAEAYILAENVTDLIDDYTREPSPDKLAQVQVYLSEIDPITAAFTSKMYDLNEHVSRMLILVMTIIIILLISFATFVSVIISQSIARPIGKLVEHFKKMANGNLKSSVKIDTKNEIGELSLTFSEIQVGLQEVIALSKKVVKGDYNVRFRQKSDEDELSPALNEMVRKLEKNQQKTKTENWLQNGISRLDDQMRGNSTVRELSDKIITFLSEFLDVEMGAVYVYDEKLGQLEFTGSIGIEKDKVAEIIRPGEGLIGKAAKHDSLQIIPPGENGYTTFSATGKFTAEKIYLLPMHYNGRIQAVIELAPIHALSEEKIEFIHQIKKRVSVILAAAVARFRNSELLRQTMEQAQKLKERDKELRQKLEENHKIQEELMKETTLLDSMLKTLPDYVYFKDIESKFLRISESMVSLFEARSSDEIIGKSDFDFHPSEDARRYYEEEQEIIKKGEGFIDVIREGIDEDGHELWTSVTKLPIFDKNGKCIGTFGISKDVTTIKKLELEVQERNQALKLQQEELKATNEELKTQEEELRVANEELSEQTKVLTENEKNLQAQQEELRVINEELENKTELLEQQKKQITDKNDNLLKIQNELRKKAKELVQASQYKSEFLANMSHELRTPLNSLLILSKLLGSNKKGNLTDDQVKSINIIHKSGNDLLNLINEILDLSKIEAGKMKYEFAEVPVSEIISEINQGFQPVAENKDLNLEIRQSQEFPKMIYTDKQRLLQIIRNLLSNAFKFTSEGGIKVKFGLPDATTLFVNDKLSHRNTCFVSVEDTGVGIPKDKAEAIFEAFQQADGSISRRFGGTGLGLSISKQLAHALGGEIQLESTEGEGSVFTVYLPLDKKLAGPENKETEKKEEPANAGEVQETSEKIDKTAPKDKPELPVYLKDDRHAENNGLTVLIIHEDKNKAQKLIDLCHKRKFNVLAVAAITDGIQLAEHYAPQAIIVSVKQSNSKELNLLKQHSTAKKLPIHVVSEIDDTVLEDIEKQNPAVPAKTSDGNGKASGNEYKQVLVVEDDEATRQAIQALFEEKDIIIHEAINAQQAYDLISAKPFDSVILDLGLPDFSGKELLKKLKEDHIPIPNIIVNTAKELSTEELRELHNYSDSIVIKGVKSDERLMDEVTLFLHQVKNTLPKIDYPLNKDELDGEGFKGKKILVVDDDIRNIFALAQILEEREMEVLEAENGKAAVEVLKRNPDIDLVLMDIMMPVMNGYEAMREIRNTREIEDVPIITLTAKAMKEDYQKAIDSGANDYISKPVDMDKLMSLLKIWLFK